jgi:GTPase SAR1 family protein
MDLVVNFGSLVSPPANITRQGWVRIKQWFADRRAQQRRPVDRLRVCFVGFGGAGKTTLARLLTDGAAATCGAVNAALPMRQWSSTQVEAWISAACTSSDQAEVQFRTRLAGVLKPVGGAALIDKVAKWDEEKVCKMAGNALSPIEVEFYWEPFVQQILNHDRKGYNSTIGIDVWEVELLVGEGQKLTVEVVDFAGQMQFYASHSLFFALKNAQYVLVSKAAAKGDGSESQIEEALYWLSLLRSSMARIRRHNVRDDAVAQVLLVVTHTDKAEPSLPPDGLLHILGQRIDKLGQPASDPPCLARGQPCVPRYDDVGKADEARSMLIRALEAQVCLSHRCAHHSLPGLGSMTRAVWFGACHGPCCAGRRSIGVGGGCLCRERGPGHRRGSEKG